MFHRNCGSKCCNETYSRTSGNSWPTGNVEREPESENTYIHNNKGISRISVASY